MIGDVTWNTTVTMSLPMCRLRGSCCLEQSADYLQLGGNSAGCRTAGHGAAAACHGAAVTACYSYQLHNCCITPATQHCTALERGLYCTVLPGAWQCDYW